MANQKLEQLLDTLLRNWNDVFGRFGKDNNDGAVVTQEQVTAAALSVGNEIYKNGLSPSVVAAAGYKSDEFNEMYNQVSQTSVHASASVASVEDKELMVNPIQIAALEAAENDAEVQEIIEDIEQDSSFVPTAPITESDNESPTVQADETENETNVSTTELKPDNAEDSPPSQAQEGSTDEPGEGTTGPTQDPIIDNAVDAAQNILGDVVTREETTTDPGQPSAGPVQMQLSYTLHPAYGQPQTKEFTDLAGLVQSLSQDAGSGVKVELNEAAFNALKSVGLIDSSMATNPGLIDLPSNPQATPAVPAVPAVDISTPAIPAVPAVPAWPSPEQENGIQAIFKQYVGRPADVNDLSIHAPRVASGFTLDQLRAEISDAPEAKAYREEVIKSHFLQIVGRPADSMDLRIHSQRLASGQVTVEQFRNELLAAPESQTFKASMLVTDSNGVTRDLYNFPPADREAAKNHIVNGGTYSQLDNMAGILNSGDQQAIANWNNFVSNGGKLDTPPPPLGGGLSGGGGGTPAPYAQDIGDPLGGLQSGTPIIDSPTRDAKPYISVPSSPMIPVSSGSNTPGTNFVAAPGANTTTIPTTTVSPGAGGPSTSIPSAPSPAPTLDVGTRINDFLLGGY